MRYQDIENNLSIEGIKNIMKGLGVYAFEETDKYIIYPTVCHHSNAEDGSMKLYFYKRNKRFYCYTECGPMTIFQFLEHYYEVRNIKYNWYQDIYNKVLNNLNITFINNFENLTINPNLFEKYQPHKLQDLPTYNKNILNTFVKYYPVEWLQDGITQDTMDKFDIKYSISENKIIIPHYNVRGELVGIRGRALNKEEIENFGKYRPIKIENTLYSHPLSLNLYGLNYTKDNIKKNGYAFLFEAEKSLMQLDNFSMDNCGVAVCGSNFNKYQLQILLRSCYPKEIIICFDKENNGFDDKYFNKLWNIGKKYSNYCNFSFIYDRENLLNLKDSPTDKGEVIFKKLLERRTRIK